MRKHVQMLTDADVDFLVFDATNGYTYTKQALKLMSILDEYQKAGWDVPQVVFYTNSNSQKTMTTIYNDIYKAHPEYSGLWFNWDGKADDHRRRVRSNRDSKIIFPDKG